MSQTNQPTQPSIHPASAYATRPADECFETFPQLIAHAQAQKDRSAERTYNLRDLQAVAVDGPKPGSQDAQAGQTVQLESPKGRANFTHWSFGQLARTIGAPANYLRTLEPSIAAQAINDGMHRLAPIGTEANLLMESNGPGTTPTVRAATSDTYGRVWDANLYGEVNRHFGDGMTSHGATGTWQSPPVWPGQKPGGNYRGDRDSYVLRIDGGSIVNDPSLQGGDGAMYRGLIIRNSETGMCSISVEPFLFRWICGNHTIGGLVMDKTFRRRHVGKDKITRETMNEIARLAWKWTQRSAAQDEAVIQTLIDHEIAVTREGVIDALRKLGATKDQATEAYDACTIHETASPRSFWGLAQGLTRISQASGYQDERLELDQLAAEVLRQGAKQFVTV